MAPSKRVFINFWFGFSLGGATLIGFVVLPKLVVLWKAGATC